MVNILCYNLLGALLPFTGLTAKVEVFLCSATIKYGNFSVIR